MLALPIVMLALPFVMLTIPHRHAREGEYLRQYTLDFRKTRFLDLQMNLGGSCLRRNDGLSAFAGMTGEVPSQE